MRWRRLSIALLIGLLAGGVAAALQLVQLRSTYDGGWGGPLIALESAAQDMALRERRPESYIQVPQAGEVAVSRDPRELLLLVTIDEKTIAELGAYNGGYPRELVAQLIDRMIADPPRAIALDIGFFEPTSDDTRLAQSFDRARAAPTRLVLAAVGFSRAPASGVLRYERGLLPVQPLAQRSDTGLSNVALDERGTIRTMPLLGVVGDTEVPAFGLAAVSAFLRRPNPVDSRTSDTLEIAGRRVPVDEASAVRINFFGSPYETFQTVSFVDVLRGRVDSAAWRGKLVMVGAGAAAGLADDYWTPVSVSRKMAGVEIHANVAATLMSTQFIRLAPVAWQIGLILGIALLISVLAVRLPVSLASFASAVVLVAGVLATLWTLFAFGIQLPLANPFLGGVLAFVGVIVWRVAIEQRQARALQRALASVIPPSVAHQIALAPERVKLGGERRTITLLFTDLKDFTGFSETVPAEVVSRMVSDYLAEMTRVVFEYGGTVDKFVGDQVMAFWNAPLDDPEHARHACLAALDMQAALMALNRAWATENLAPQRMRIGMHTGVASVGNMGTPRRFAYTALGDNVNLAARLEPLNKEYGTSICVSQDTLDAAGRGFLVRFLDVVAVKGKKMPVAVYELLGRAGEADFAPLLAPFERGVQLYRAQEFEQAAEHFRVALTALGNGEDAPSAVYLARCEVLAANPPGPDWDGVYVMEHK